MNTAGWTQKLKYNTETEGSHKLKAVMNSCTSHEPFAHQKHNREFPIGC